MVESPQLHTQKIVWRIVDAKDGELENGIIMLGQLKEQMPWGIA